MHVLQDIRQLLQVHPIALDQPDVRWELLETLAVHIDAKLRSEDFQALDDYFRGIARVGAHDQRSVPGVSQQQFPRESMKAKKIPRECMNVKKNSPVST